MQQNIQQTLSTITTLFTPAFANLAPIAIQATTQASASFTTMESSIKGTLSRVTILFNPAFAPLAPIVSQNTTNASASFTTMESSIKGTLSRITALFPQAFEPLVTAAQTTTQQAANHFTRLESTIKGLMSLMSSHVSDFASDFKSSMDSVIQDAENATQAVEDLQSAINALEDKTVTVTYEQKTTGSAPSGYQHGGSFLNTSSVSYAAGGRSWIQKTPTMLGNSHVAEVYPEFITVTPLDPREKASPFYNMEIPMASTTTRGGGGGSGGSSVMVTGDLYVTVQTQSGEVLANQVKPYLLKNFSGITA
jgi:hypothetical protein